MPRMVSSARIIDLRDLELQSGGIGVFHQRLSGLSERAKPRPLVRGAGVAWAPEGDPSLNQRRTSADTFDLILGQLWLEIWLPVKA